MRGLGQLHSYREQSPRDHFPPPPQEIILTSNTNGNFKGIPKPFSVFFFLMFIYLTALDLSCSMQTLLVAACKLLVEAYGILFPDQG